MEISQLYGNLKAIKDDENSTPRQKFINAVTKAIPEYLGELPDAGDAKAVYDDIVNGYEVPEEPTE
jgi:hypothetical protein